MALQLFPHNQTAYEAAMKLIAEEGKAAVIHPTGTGKSFIAFKLALEHPTERVCWLAPSAYIYKTQVGNLAAVMQDFEPEMLSNICFMTYSKLMMNEDQMGNLKPDWIICDEFHRAGSAQWGKSVLKLIEMYPRAGLLGLSATNIRYLDNQRDMAEELFEGHVASEMTLGEAIAREILPAPMYIISMYSYKQELERVQKRIRNEKNPGMRAANEKLLEQLKRTLEHAEGLNETFSKYMKKPHGRYLVFCSGKEHMQEMMEKSREWFWQLDKTPHLYSITHDDPNAEREYAAFQKDESNHLRLLFSIDMLNEGIHVEGVDGVILLRPTISPILYLQQIGRALAVGTHTQPVIFDIVNNFDGLYAIDSIRQEAEAFFAVSPDSEKMRVRFAEQFRVIDEIRDCRSIFEAIKRSLSAGWETYYLEAKSYYEKNGSLDIPKSYSTISGLALGSWLMTQRRVYEGKIPGSLSEEQVERLNAIGMDWNSGSDKSFEKGYEALESYYKVHGHSDVLSDYVTENGYRLGKWVGNIRRKYKGVSGKKLTGKQIERLEALGMIWDKTEHQWKQNYEKAKAYYLEHGHLRIPHDYITADGTNLGIWLDHQRSVYSGKKSKAASLSEERKKKLEAIGMEWDTVYDRQWETRYQYAKMYYKTHGNLRVPVTYVTQDGVQLGRWINRQREQERKHTLSRERKRLLNRIGFEVDIRLEEYEYTEENKKAEF